MSIWLVIILAVIAFVALIVWAGYRHQSARPDRRRNTTKTPGGNRRA